MSHIYITAFVRDNRVETVECFTKSLNKAQFSLIDMVSKAFSQQEARKLLDDFCNGVLTDNCTVENDGLVAQLFPWTYKE